MVVLQSDSHPVDIVIVRAHLQVSRAHVKYPFLKLIDKVIHVRLKTETFTIHLVDFFRRLEALFGEFGDVVYLRERALQARE